MIGQSLEEVRKDLQLMPLQALLQYKNNPGKRDIDGLPLDMLAGLELSRRAQMQQNQTAMGAQGAQNMPTVVDGDVQKLTGGIQSVAQQPPQPGAPQPQPQPQQPTRALAQGGLTSLGQYMQDTETPVVMMSHGGPIAFAKGKDVPSADDISPDDIVFDNDPNQYKTVPLAAQSNMTAPAPETREERVARKKAEADATRARLAANAAALGQRLQPNAPPIVANRPEASPPAAAPPPAAPATPPENFKIQHVGQGGSALRMPSQGGSGSKDLKDLLAQYSKLSPEEENVATVGKEVETKINALKSPEISEADRARMIEEQYNKNQATSNPHYAKMEKMLEEERARTSQSREDAKQSALLKLGLGLLGTKQHTLGGAIGEAGQGALSQHEQAQQAADLAETKTRQAHMDLLKARMADEKGDRKAAQEYFDSYQRNKREAYTADLNAQKLRMDAATARAGVVNRHDKLESGLAGVLGKIESTNQLSAARNEASILRNLILLQRMQQGQNASPQDLIRVNTYLDTQFAPGGEGYKSVIASNPQLAAMNTAKTLKPDNPRLIDAVKNAKDEARKNIFSQSSKPGHSGGMQGADDLERILGIR